MRPSGVYFDLLDTKYLSHRLWLWFHPGLGEDDGEDLGEDLEEDLGDNIESFLDGDPIFIALYVLMLLWPVSKAWSEPISLDILRPFILSNLLRVLWTVSPNSPLVSRKFLPV